MDLDAEYSEYRAFITEFVRNIDPNDQLPIRVSGYCLRDYEIHGEILDWIINYLSFPKNCPTTLHTFLIQTALKRTLEKCKDSPKDCGYDEERQVYQPLKLVRVAAASVNEVIMSLQDNSKLYEVPLPPTSPNASEIVRLKHPPKYVIDAIKNTRRSMEDRHIVLDDFNEFFNTQDTEPTYYFAIFDGHSGTDAASYSNSHLNYNIAVHPKYPSDIAEAMRSAFRVTDIEFMKKARAENLSSGTTALCCIYRKTEKKLFIGWCGDSQAVITRLGSVRQIVKKHSPADESERQRIEDLGGCVLLWSGTYRVNGALSVSRAIGDMAHKPFISAEPDVEVINLDGEEDFLVMGCDGLFDNLSEDDIALCVYKRLQENPENYRTIATDLCSLAKLRGSRDNISVIVLFLKEPELIATQSWPSQIESIRDMENLYDPESQIVPSAAQVTVDALGNTNQDIYNNPFGDFNNQLISDVAMGKSTEITDMVMQQQPEFCNLTDTMTSNLNNINNNKINNGARDNFMMEDNEPRLVPETPLQSEVAANVLVLNDDNNNSNNEFAGPDMGPETDVDAIDDDDFQYSAGSVVSAAEVGEKEKAQMELKETEDLVDRSETFDFSADVHAHSAKYGNLESKIFEELSLHNPDLKMGSNPFATSDDNEAVDEAAEVQADEFIDNKLLDEKAPEIKNFEHFEEHEEEKLDNVDVIQGYEEPAIDDEDENNMLMNEEAHEVHKEIFSANDEESEQNEEMMEEEQEDVANQPQPEPELDLGIGVTITTTAQHQTIGESGEEESEDEWNYVKVDKKLEGLTVVEEQSEPVIESPFGEERATEDFTQFELHAEQQQASEIAEILTASDKPVETIGVEVEKQEKEEVVEEEELEQQQSQSIESQPESTDKDIEQEKEPEAIEQEKEPEATEGKILQEEFQKDLQLVIETDENSDEMESQLNPDAKEFVPVSPTRSNGMESPPFTNGGGFINPVNAIFGQLEKDSVVAQSPRKGDFSSMEDVQVPTENEFDTEADRRPHEVDLLSENVGFAPIESPEMLNLKESMQQDDKLAQEYKDDSQFFEEEKPIGEDYKVLESSFDQYSNSFKNNIDDPMNRSFYEGRDGDILAPQPAQNILNTVQPIPPFEDDLSAGTEVKMSQSDGDADWMGEDVTVQEKIAEAIITSDELHAVPLADSSEDFTAEKFVEEVKGGAYEEDKYVDNGLSPTFVNVNTSETITETIFVESPSVENVLSTDLDTVAVNTSETSIKEVPEERHEQPEIEIALADLQEIPEMNEPPCTTAVAQEESHIAPATAVLEETLEEKSEDVPTPEVKVDLPKVEDVLAGAAAVGAVAVASTIIAAKKKPITGKPEVKAKATAAPKTSTVPPKKPAPIAKAPLSKPSSAPVKPAVPKTTVSAARPAPKAVPSSASAASRPASKPITSTVPKKPMTAGTIPKTTDGTVKPTPATRTTVAARKPVTSVAATKPLAAKPSTATVTAKPKLTNGSATATDRKPLASSAPISRAPAKPTTLTAKPKTNGAPSSTLVPPTKSPSATSRVFSSAAKSPSQTKSIGSATARAVPKSTAAVKTDAKSPSTAKPPPSTLGAVGIKKPLTTTVKKSPTADKGTAITKKATSPTKTSAVVKKTSTTTVVKKSVVDGEVVKQETTTVTKTQSGDGPVTEEIVKTELNGHSHENGASDAVQMVLDSAAD